MIKRKLPVLICFITGIFMFSQFFIPHRAVQAVFIELNQWTMIIVAGSLIIGIFSLIKHHWNKIKNKKENWKYSIITICSMAFMVLFGMSKEFKGLYELLFSEYLLKILESKGLFHGMDQGSLFDYTFKNIMTPLESTMFALLAFYIASASFRAFKTRTVEATLLLISAVIVMLGRVPIGYAISDILPKLSTWILEFPNTAAKRAILIGIGLGMCSTAVKIIMGIEKPYLGRLSNNGNRSKNADE